MIKVHNSLYTPTSCEVLAACVILFRVYSVTRFPIQIKIGLHFKRTKKKNDKNLQLLKIIFRKTSVD